MGTLTAGDVKQTSQIYSTPRSLGDPVFLQLESDIVTAGTIAESASTAFYSATGLVQFCLTFDNGAPTGISVTARLYSDSGLSKAASTSTYDTIFGVNPNVIWTITAVGTRVVSEIYTINRGWHKLAVTDSPTVGGTDTPKVGLGFRDM